MPPTPLSPTLRRATVEDAAVLARLGADTFLASYAGAFPDEDMAMYMSEAFAPARLAAELEDPRGAILLASIDNTPVGYGKLREAPPPACLTGPAPLELQRLYVLGEFQGRKIGDALIQGCIDEARRRGRRTLWLMVWKPNLRAQAFYQRWGFERVGEQEFFLGNTRMVDWVLARSL
ncbi:MAG: GNAT family N-acetyltransferase [Myxococcaceae bacterium]|nr:GNAT family N-acetyltransferase [Myxococcaceae bacterium]